MAILNPNIWVDDNTIPSTLGGTGFSSVITPKTIDYPIQGKMLATSLTMSPYEAEQMGDHEMKTLLISQMVREIWDNNCIEFTKQQDYANDEVIIRARIFVTPNDDVQLIRKVQK
jgi:hypothetical protein